MSAKQAPALLLLAFLDVASMPQTTPRPSFAWCGLTDEVTCLPQISSATEFVTTQGKSLPHAQALKPSWQAIAAHRLTELRAATTNGDGPNDIAIERAEQVLEILHIHDLCPTRILPSAEGGVGICFVAGNRYADVECFNSGEVVAIRKDATSGEREVWELDVNDMSKELLDLAVFIREASS